LEFLSTPERASVNESVEMCRTFRKASAAGFVNAVLRRFVRERPSPPSGTSVSALAVRHSHPEWLVRRYLDRYPQLEAIDLLERNNRVPSQFVRVNRFKIDPPGFRARLREQGIPFADCSGLRDCVLVEAPGFARHPLVRQGYGWLMDAGSQEIAELGDVEEGAVLGDFCAAPGGKAFILAARKSPRARLLCCDIHLGRLREMRERSRRCVVPGIELVAADLTTPPPFRTPFDFILLDAPCSGLGTLRSNPDIRWKVDEARLAEHHRRQTALLNNAFSVLRSGGEIVYSTCSTEPEENEDVVEEFLAAHPTARLEAEYFRTFPRRYPGECFFAARIRHL
jgi:16S rRNA (cytosine967-C5)-methyltransferase